MPKISDVPKLTNRGAAGLLTKLPEGFPTELSEPSKPVKEVKIVKDKIAQTLLKMCVAIESLKLDPDNARLHPERNIEAIKHSLCLYGQVKPVVVRKATMVVVAGNGTLEAAKGLGWTKLAASIVDMTAIEAAGYGLADNRTAELAAWDFEVVGRLDKLLQEARVAPVGWSFEELAVLRMGDFCPLPQDFPTVDENLPTDHICPKCGYRFSGGELMEKNSDA